MPEVIETIEFNEVLTYDVHAVFSVEDHNDLAGLIWWLRWVGAQVVNIERKNRKLGGESENSERKP